MPVTDGQPRWLTFSPPPEVWRPLPSPHCTFGGTTPQSLPAALLLPPLPRRREGTGRDVRRTGRRVGLAVSRWTACAGRFAGAPRYAPEVGTGSGIGSLGMVHAERSSAPGPLPPRSTSGFVNVCGSEDCGRSTLTGVTAPDGSSSDTLTWKLAAGMPKPNEFDAVNQKHRALAGSSSTKTGCAGSVKSQWAFGMTPAHVPWPT